MNLKALELIQIGFVYVHESTPYFYYSPIKDAISNTELFENEIRFTININLDNRSVPVIYELKRNYK